MTPMFHAGGLFVFLTPLFYVGGLLQRGGQADEALLTGGVGDQGAALADALGEHAQLAGVREAAHLDDDRAVAQAHEGTRDQLGLGHVRGDLQTHLAPGGEHLGVAAHSPGQVDAVGGRGFTQGVDLGRQVLEFVPRGLEQLREFGVTAAQGLDLPLQRGCAGGLGGLGVGHESTVTPATLGRIHPRVMARDCPGSGLHDRT